MTGQAMFKISVTCWGLLSNQKAETTMASKAPTASTPIVTHSAVPTHGGNSTFVFGFFSFVSVDSSAASSSAAPSPAGSGSTAASSGRGDPAIEFSSAPKSPSIPAGSTAENSPECSVAASEACSVGKVKSAGSVKSNSSTGPRNWKSSAEAFVAKASGRWSSPPQARSPGPLAVPARDHPRADDRTPAFHPSDRSQFLSSQAKRLAFQKRP